MRRGIVVSILALAVILMANNRASSDGAVAEGIAPGGVAKGYGISMRVDRPDKETARADALAGCRKGPEKTAAGAALDDGNAKARARCEVVATFKDKCATVALDPKDGTPGAGWATGDTQQDADEEALSRCRTSAGARREFCKVIDQLCDGTAK
jgi:hypothetical protein